MLVLACSSGVVLAPASGRSSRQRSTQCLFPRSSQLVCAAAESSSGRSTQTSSTRPAPPKRQPKVLISGGSIAGLAAAAALANLGFSDVHVFEERAVLGGAGRSNCLSIWPSGVRALRAIAPGLDVVVKRDSAEFKRRLLRTAAGEAIQDFPAQFLEKYGESALMIQWQRLHHLLEQHVPQDRVHRRTRLVHFSRASEGGIDAVFAGPDGEEKSVHGDVLLGCDGIRSVVRRELLGDEGLRDGGYFLISTTVPLSALPTEACTPDTAITTFENGRMGMFMDVGMGVVGVNLGARNDLLPSLAHLESKRERWAALAAPDGGHGARRRGGEWCFLLISGWPFHAAIAPLLDESNIREDKIVDRPPVDPERMRHAGPVSLVGDALHLMVPSLGFGAVSALEGGLEVAQCLAQEFGGGGGGGAGGAEEGGGDAERALRRYEGARLERATAVQLQSFSQSSRWGEHHRKEKEEQPQEAVGAGVGGGGASNAGAAAATKKENPSAAAAAGAAPTTPASGKFGASGASALVLSQEFTDWMHSYTSPWGGTAGGISEKSSSAHAAAAAAAAAPAAANAKEQ